MKYSVIIIIILMLFLANSCESKENRQHRLLSEIASSDSIINSKSEIDSKIDSLSLIAWGDSKFGMTMREAITTKAFSKGQKYDNYISLGYSSSHISGTKFGIYTFDAWFEMDELYYINIISCEKTANYLDQMKDDLSVIVRGFSEKYGEPIYIKRDFNIFTFKTDDEFIYAKWDVGSKKIKIQLGESRSEYYYRIIIRNSSFPSKPNIEKKKSEEKAEKERIEKRKNEF